MRLLLAFLITVTLHAATVTTAQYNNARTGANDVERTLTSTTVAYGKFGAVWTSTLDGAVFTQPLYAPVGARNAVLVATMNNTVYALDSADGSTIWSTNLGTPSNISNVPYLPAFPGIASTPVIDLSNAWLFCVSANQVAGLPQYQLHKLNLTTGAQIGSAVVIAGSVAGTGTGSSAGTLTFAAVAATQSQRTPLTLTAAGRIVFGFGSTAEPGIWHGWVFSYNESLVRQAVWCSTPNGNGGGVWESSGGLAVDSGGNIYGVTGNGDYDGITEFGQTVFKLNGSLVLQDWFTPSDNAATTTLDADFSSGRAMLIPTTNKITLGSKDARIWVINTTDMGHLQGSGTAPQVFSVGSIVVNGDSGIFGGLFFQNVGYFQMNSFPMSAFTFSGSTYTTTPLARTVYSFSVRGGQGGSSNSGANPIVWQTTAPSTQDQFVASQQITLRAYNPATLVEYWNSGAIGTVSSYAAPTVVDGSVYVSTFDGTVTRFSATSTLSSRSGGRQKLFGRSVFR